MHRFHNEHYGKFKGIINICEKTWSNEYEKLIEDTKANRPYLLDKLRDISKNEKWTRAIIQKKPVVIRVYVWEWNDLAKKDKLSYSDPFIKIFLGGELKVNEQKLHQNDWQNCKWYKHYDIAGEFPGPSTLQIDVWDYDPIFSDELIGSTKIDWEDRFYNSEWRDMKQKPIEIRGWTHPDISGNQGNVYLWIEILEKKTVKQSFEPWMIAPEPETLVEVRLVVWETENIKCMDVEGTSDIYINAYITPETKQSTDIHFRCSNGAASFNWRMVFPVLLPKDNRVITFQVYDNDIFKRNDFICGGTWDVRDWMKIPKDLDLPITFNKYYVNALSADQKEKYKDVEFLSKSEDAKQEKFWIQWYKNNQKEGRVLCSLEVFPEWKSELNKVGKGRSEPNVSPYLPPPVGRFQFSLNPFSMMNQWVGPKFRNKVCCGILLVALCLYLAFAIPYIVLHLTGEILNPFNYIKK